MKTPRLHYFKKNTIELPEGYRKPIKHKRKAVAQTALQQIQQTPQKPVIRRRTPRGRLMPLRMKNEFIPPGVDWCQINGQKVRQDIYFGDVRGRMFIPGQRTGDGCEGACTPSMYDFGGGCGCEGCDSGCEGCASSSCADSGCETAGCADTGCAVDGCAGCGSDTGCETSGCAETGCTTTSDTGCTDSGCAQAGCAETGCSTTSDTGCDTGCSVSCADSGCDTGCATGGCGGCEGCISCADTGCTACADTGCSMAPTGGVDFTGGGMGFGYGPGPGGNMGIGNAMGPPGWATGDFGMQGYGGPTGTGAGPGSTASIGGPAAYGSPTANAGINGFPGDFGAPPGGAFGMPGDVGPQAGPGMPGGPPTTQQGEALNPSLFGPEVTAPDRVAPDDRTEVDPTTVFGPAVTANAGWFGPSQAQAASRGTDQDIINAANLQAMFANDFGKTGPDMTAYIAATNPGLAQALSQIATNFNADPANDPANYAGPSPGAQQGFTGTSAQQGTMSFDSFGGKGDNQNQSGRADVQQTNPNFDLVGPMVTQQGYQQLAAEMNAQRADQQTPTAQPDNFASRFDAVQSPNQAVQNAFDALSGKPAQSDTFDSRFQSMQAPAYDPSARPAETQMTPQQTISNAFDALTAANQQQAMQQAAPFDAQSRGEQDRAGRADDTFDSRFGNFPMTADMFDAQSRGEQSKGEQLAPWAQNETIGLRPGEDVISNLNPFTLGVGREAAPLGLWSMANNEPAGRPGGSPAGLPGGGRPGSGPFGPSQDGGRPGLSITVGGRPGGGPGYYQTGGAGIAPGAKGAEYGGAYGINSPGRPGTSAFGGDFRQGGGGGAWFYDPASGQYFQAGGRR